MKPAKKEDGKSKMRFVDLFCGVGGFHLAASSVGMKCVFACDIDERCRKVYEKNFNVEPQGDISVAYNSIPDHDLLLAGFPCQPFSIIGKRKGFEESRGTLFLEIARIVAQKKPSAVLLENVKQLSTISKGKVLLYIVTTLELLGYEVYWRVLNVLDYGLPQKRERVFIVGLKEKLNKFEWPEKLNDRRSLEDVLEKSPAKKHFVSKHIYQSRRKVHQAKYKPAIWHENKGGNVSSHPFSCALRAGASYNYLLVDGERRLTPREMFRLQGFPDTFELDNSDAQARKQAGNAIAVPMAKSVVEKIVYATTKVTG